MGKAGVLKPITESLSDSFFSPEKILSQYLKIRQNSEEICKPLENEDYGIQSMPDVSPPKWHLAHTTWFFETFVLLKHRKGYKVFHPQFQYLFNSYYKALGKHHPRSERGLLSRPTVKEVFKYRHSVDQAMTEFLEQKKEGLESEIEFALVLGLHHEQQHQELLLMDIKHIFYSNPLRPIYQNRVQLPNDSSPSSLKWISYKGGLKEIGFEGEGFSFDNESPRHRYFLEDFRLASRPVTNGEFLEFIEDGSYQEPLLWLSDGWDVVNSQGLKAPLYWEKKEGAWQVFTLSGMQPLDPHEPASHVSFFEAEAFAAWAKKRLPTEEEWEHASEDVPIEGSFLESENLHPAVSPPVQDTTRPHQLFGDTWEWTRSAYSPYPGFRPTSGHFAEYNGKFMCNQYVLRGGSCLTPLSHIRRTYRNFFQPSTRWQCSGIRLAEDV